MWILMKTSELLKVCKFSFVLFLFNLKENALK